MKVATKEEMETREFQRTKGGVTALGKAKKGGFKASAPERSPEVKSFGNSSSAGKTKVLTQEEIFATARINSSAPVDL